MDARDLPKFERAVKKNELTGCHIWQNAKDKNGYGLFTVTRPRIVMRRAHRVAYEHYVGPLVGKLFVLHRCDNPSCVNPDHLFLGTNQDNMDDMKAKGRAPKTLGEISGNTRFTEEDVLAIRARYASGVRKVTLAREYKVNSSCIWKIVNRQRWAHI